ELFRQVGEVGHRRGSARVGVQQVHILLPESRVLLAAGKAVLQLLDGGGENFRQEGAAVLAVVAFAAVGKIENGHRDGVMASEPAILAKAPAGNKIGVLRDRRAIALSVCGAHLDSIWSSAAQPPPWARQRPHHVAKYM